MRFPFINMNYVGDTIHLWAIVEALYKAQCFDKIPRRWYVNGKYACLFEGSESPIVVGEDTSFNIDNITRWTGAVHNQHARDTYADLLYVKNFDLKTLLPLARYRDEQPYAVLCPHSKEPRREWPLNRWIPIAEELHGRGLEVFMNHSKEVPIHGLPGFVHLIWPPLKELAILLRDAKIVVGVDGGHQHISDAMGNIPVGIHGSTASLSSGPYSSQTFCVDVHKEVWDYPWAYHSGWHTAKNQMYHVSVEAVLEKIRHKLQSL